MYPINLRNILQKQNLFLHFVQFLHKTPIKNAAGKKSGQTRTLTAEHVIYRFASFFAQKTSSAPVRP